MPADQNLIDIVNKYPNVQLDTACWSAISDGWLPIFEEMVKKLSTLPGVTTIEQTKEKFGELRVYISVDKSIREEAYKIVDEAEQNSKQTCEYCGKPGKYRGKYSDGTYRGWVKTLCKACNVPSRKV